MSERIDEWSRDAVTPVTVDLPRERKEPVADPMADRAALYVDEWDDEPTQELPADWRPYMEDGER